MLERIRTLMEEKGEYRRQLARAAALPERYRQSFEALQQYLWPCAAGDGRDVLEAQGELLDLMEEGAAEGRTLPELVGEDVAGFCDSLLQGRRLWIEDQARKTNRRIAKRRNHT